MLMLTHTWILYEFLGKKVDKNLDIFAYNVAPDILCIHDVISSKTTHGLSRLPLLPPQYIKASYVYFHLLIDDIAHHGKISDTPIKRFNPDSNGYTYTKGRHLIEPITSMYESLGKSITYANAAYQAHMIIEMAFDLALYQGEGNESLVPLFCEAITYTENHQMTEFSNTLSWLYGMDKDIIIEAMRQGVHSCSEERMQKLMDVEGRVHLFANRFGFGKKDNRALYAVKKIMIQGMNLVSDYRNFLHPALQTIKESGLFSTL